MNTTHDTPRIKVRLTPTQARRLGNRRLRHAARLAMRLVRLGREVKGAQ
jgi:hypothetical protein